MSPTSETMPIRSSPRSNTCHGKNQLELCLEVISLLLRYRFLAHDPGGGVPVILGSYANMAWLLIASTIVIGLALSSIFAYVKNYRAAKSAGFPIKVCIANGLHPIFLIGSVSARYFFRKLPWPLSRFGEMGYYGWTYDDYMAGNVHNKIGPIFTLVTSWGNQLVVADPEVALTMTAKWKVFTKPPTQQSLALFGPNLDTVEGNDWNKHRRLTAPCFNERSSGMVWDESRAQAIGMLQKLKKAGKLGVQSLADDSQKLALHVLSRVAFGLQSNFDAGDNVPPGYTLSFKRSIQLIIGNLVICLIFGAKLAAPIFPAHWREAGRGFAEYDKYVQDIVNSEKKKLDSGNTSSNNLISVLLRASEADDKQSPQSSSLSVAEVKGNCFIFTVAGHDTTANSLSLAIAQLCSRPQVQDWLNEEINAIIGTAEPDYEEHFPRLVRCQAAMLETLRLYPAVPELPKYTGENHVPIVLNGKEHTLPPHLHCLINVIHLHRMKKYWGDDADEWRPERWIVQSPTANPNNTGSISKTATTNHKSETIWEPHRGTYMPWAEGPRICPGSKFARVEFVATMVTLFQQYKVRPLPVGHESDAQARDRAKSWATEAHARGVAMNLVRPEDVTLVWEERD